MLARGGRDNRGNTTINRGLRSGKREGGKEADAIVTVIVALEAAGMMQQVTTAGWEERDKATAITKQQVPTPAEVQGRDLSPSWLGRRPPSRRHVGDNNNNNNRGGD